MNASGPIARGRVRAAATRLISTRSVWRLVNHAPWGHDDLKGEPRRGNTVSTLSAAGS
jgi:hypothetical protein